MSITITFLILYLIIIFIIILVKGGGSDAAGINLSSFGDGFHTVNGVTIGPDGKFTSRKWNMYMCFTFTE